MRLIKTSLQLGQAVKNVQRLRQIVAVFGKHGFADVVDRMSLGKFLPPGRIKSYAISQADKSTPEHLREAFEELGPVFVKLGQLLSMRSDLIPENFVEELKKLQDSVHPVPFAQIKTQVEAELEKPLSDSFASFNELPLAAASVAQAHEAKLLSGETVVVKVQRPDIEKIVETDISLLAFMANLLEKYVPESRVFNPKVIVDEFFRTLSLELNFVIEANNIQKISENFAQFQDIVIPKVYMELSTEKVLTLERLHGIRISDLEAVRKSGADTKRIVELGARVLFQAILVDGLFHGDLHGGNLFLLEGGKLGVIDFGIVGRLSEKSRAQLANMVLALLNEDYENLCYLYAELGTISGFVDFESFQREVRNTLSPYVGLSIQNINSGRLLMEATRIAAKYNIRVPGDWMLVFKALFTIEGLGRELDPEFDMMSLGQELISELVKNHYSPQKITRDFLWVARDVATLLQVLPRQIRWMFRKLNSNDFAFEIKTPQLDGLPAQVNKNGKRSSLSILAAGFFISGALALSSPLGSKIGDFPSVAVALFILGLATVLRLFLLR